MEWKLPLEEQAPRNPRKWHGVVIMAIWPGNNCLFPFFWMVLETRKSADYGWVLPPESESWGLPKKVEYRRSMACRGVGCGLPTRWSTLLASPLLGGHMWPDQKLDTHILGTVINPLTWICIPMTMIPIMEFQRMTIIYKYYLLIFTYRYTYIDVYIYLIM